MDVFHGDPGMVDGNIVVCEVPKALYAELYKLFCKLFGAAANAISSPPGEYVRKNETQGIDGDPHKRWSMWFNSKQREEPYLLLTSR